MPRPNHRRASGTSAMAGSGLNIAVSVLRSALPSRVVTATVDKRAAQTMPITYPVRRRRIEVSARSGNTPFLASRHSEAKTSVKVGKSNALWTIEAYTCQATAMSVKIKIRSARLLVDNRSHSESARLTSPIFSGALALSCTRTGLSGSRLASSCMGCSSRCILDLVREQHGVDLAFQREEAFGMITVARPALGTQFGAHLPR